MLRFQAVLERAETSHLEDGHDRRPDVALRTAERRRLASGDLLEAVEKFTPLWGGRNAFR